MPHPALQVNTSGSPLTVKGQFPEQQLAEGLTNLEMGLSECLWQRHLGLSAWELPMRGCQSVLIPTNGIEFTFTDSMHVTHREAFVEQSGKGNPCTYSFAG